MTHRAQDTTAAAPGGARPARGRPRPRFLRALGRQEPPPRVVIDGRDYRLLEIYKHDSWAASAVYEAVDAPGPSGHPGPSGASGPAESPASRVVCKFNRQQSIFIIPMKWLGRRLARREALMLRTMNRTPAADSVPRVCGPVSVDGRVLDYAVAHDYVPGRPFAAGDRVDDDFFPRLRATLEEVHRQGWAYVDLHKRENIIVDPRGRPVLIDFQICFMPSRGLIGRSWPVQWFLRKLQGSDWYHLHKHICRHRPDQLPPGQRDVDAGRPWFNRLVRAIANPIRGTRRRLLVLLGVRKGPGQSTSEIDPEDAVRREMQRARRDEDQAVR